MKRSDMQHLEILKKLFDMLFFYNLVIKEFLN